MSPHLIWSRRVKRKPKSKMLRRARQRIIPANLFNLIINIPTIAGGNSRPHPMLEEKTTSLSSETTKKTNPQIVKGIWETISIKMVKNRCFRRSTIEAKKNETGSWMTLAGTASEGASTNKHQVTFQSYAINWIAFSIKLQLIKASTTSTTPIAQQIGIKVRSSTLNKRVTHTDLSKTTLSWSNNINNRSNRISYWLKSCRKIRIAWRTSPATYRRAVMPERTRLTPQRSLWAVRLMPYHVSSNPRTHTCTHTLDTQAQADCQRVAEKERIRTFKFTHWRSRIKGWDRKMASRCYNSVNYTKI